MIEALKKYKIVVIGGGHGPDTLEKYLINQSWVDLHSIAAGQWDNGGHTGKLREKYQIPGVGDLLTRLSTHITDTYFAEHLLYRYKGERPCSELLASLVHREKSLTDGWKRFLILFQDMMKGAVYPLTDAASNLIINVEEGQRLEGEKLIDEWKVDQPPISSVELKPEDATITEDSREAIKDADMKVIAPGTFHGSICPSLKVKGVIEALNENPKSTVMFINAFNHPDTKDWKASDFVCRVKELGLRIDYLMVPKITHAIPENYIKENYQPVDVDIQECNALGCPKIFEVPTKLEEWEENKIKKQVVRHDGKEAGKLLLQILKETNTELASGLHPAYLPR